jgi:hypothetical protein
MATRVFISFDYDNDNDKDHKELLVGQAKNPDSPFEISDASVKYHLTGDWEEKVKSGSAAGIVTTCSNTWRNRYACLGSG